MRIVQIIDSLEVGGAERMAINYANALSKRNHFSGLIATRKEGDLISQIESNVDYLFLNKKKTLDFKAVFRLKSYCVKNKIEIVQPHGSSYFMAFLLKMTYPKIQIIWHDHYGLSEFLHSRNSFTIKICSFFFKGIISVNDQLKEWAKRELKCKNVIYLPNFTNKETTIRLETTLKGEIGKKIICLANLREQKNHFLLLKIAVKLRKSHPDWSFHLIGKDFGDEYSREVKQIIKTNKLEETVFLYGSKNDIINIIKQSEIAILTSKSEGLPVALLEYGLNKKPVVVTNVGEIPLIIENEENGFIVPSENEEVFYNSLIKLIENPDLRVKLGNNLHATVMQNNTEDGVISQYLNWLNKI